MKNNPTRLLAKTSCWSCVFVIGIFCVGFFCLRPESTSLHSVVSLDGTLVPWAKVAFVSTDASQQTVLLTANQNGMCYCPDLEPGDYRILVKGSLVDFTRLDDDRIAELDDDQRQIMVKSQPKLRPSQKRIPSEYAEAETSPLTVRVIKGQLNHISLELSAKVVQMTDATGNLTSRR